MFPEQGRKGIPISLTERFPKLYVLVGRIQKQVVRWSRKIIDSRKRQQRFFRDGRKKRPKNFPKGFPQATFTGICPDRAWSVEETQAIETRP
jgi:hypothetical protein